MTDPVNVIGSALCDAIEMCNTVRLTFGRHIVQLILEYNKIPVKFRITLQLFKLSIHCIVSFDDGYEWTQEAPMLGTRSCILDYKLITTSLH